MIAVLQDEMIRPGWERTAAQVCNDAIDRFAVDSQLAERQHRSQLDTILAQFTRRVREDAVVREGILLATNADAGVVQAKPNRSETVVRWCKIVHGELYERATKCSLRHQPRKTARAIPAIL